MRQARGEGRAAVIRGEIWLAALDPTIGSEIQKTRPCVILSPPEMNEQLRTVMVAPMTTDSRPAPSRIPVFSREKQALSCWSRSAPWTNRDSCDGWAPSAHLPSATPSPPCAKSLLNRPARSSFRNDHWQVGGRAAMSRFHVKHTNPRFAAFADICSEFPASSSARKLSPDAPLRQRRGCHRPIYPRPCPNVKDFWRF